MGREEMFFFFFAKENEAKKECYDETFFASNKIEKFLFFF